MSEKRAYDLILWGATGFAGRLTAEYIDETFSEEFRWAIAGRNRDKLERVREGLNRSNGWPEIELADAFDRDRLEQMASQTRVVCSTVGPYAKLGSELVAACVTAGTDYCDLTGEVHWVRQMIDAHHERASRDGVRIVHCCGFDSVPSDIGVLAVQREAHRRYDTSCEQIRMIVRGASGGMSGGTMASMANAFEEAGDNPEIRRLLEGPYGLNPEGERQGPDDSWQKGVRWDEEAETWTAPFMMASVNEQVVRRTNAICGWPYGRSFRYGESIATGDGLGGAAKAGAVVAGLTAFSGALAVKPTRALLQTFVFPESGDGPDRETVENGYFSIELLGRGESASGETFRVGQKVRADRDPGYGATATMLAECARMLAETAEGGEDDGDEPSDWFRPLDGGVLTPASALGPGIIERLDSAGIDISTVDATDE